MTKIKTHINNMILVKGEKMRLKVKEQSSTGLNTKFVNVDSGKVITLNQAISQIEKGNPNYKGYQTVNMPNGTTYVRSIPDGRLGNNIEYGRRSK